MKIVGSCEGECDLVACLQGNIEAAKELCMRDGLMAEAMQGEPGATEQLMNRCRAGGPHKIFLGGGRLACSSTLLEAPSDAGLIST